MLVHVRAQDLSLLGAIYRHLEKRVRAGLGPWAARISSVALALSDINGPRGGADLRCAVTVELLPAGSVRAEATDSDLLSAVGRAVARARRAIQDAVNREHRIRPSRRAPSRGAAAEPAEPSGREIRG
jgi:hypothetical protein